MITNYFMRSLLIDIIIIDINIKYCRFAPTSKDIEVVDKCLDNVDFSQLRSTLKGRIACMSPCPPITVNLKPKGKGPTKQAVAQSKLFYNFTFIY